ncbi:hypothetical protein MRX96_006891 [Rhipicephalus microplus]
MGADSAGSALNATSIELCGQAGLCASCRKIGCCTGSSRDGNGSLRFIWEGRRVPVLEATALPIMQCRGVR